MDGNKNSFNIDNLHSLLKYDRGGIKQHVYEPLLYSLRLLKVANDTWSKHYGSEVFHRQTIICSDEIKGIIPYMTIFEPLVRTSSIVHHHKRNRRGYNWEMSMMAEVYVHIYMELEELRELSEPKYPKLSYSIIKSSLKQRHCLPLSSHYIDWFINFAKCLFTSKRCVPNTEESDMTINSLEDKRYYKPLSIEAVEKFNLSCPSAKEFKAPRKIPVSEDDGHTVNKNELTSKRHRSSSLPREFFSPNEDGKIIGLHIKRQLYIKLTEARKRSKSSLDLNVSDLNWETCHLAGCYGCLQNECCCDKMEEEFDDLYPL